VAQSSACWDKHLLPEAAAGPTATKNTDPDPARPRAAPSPAASHLLVQRRAHEAGLARDRRGTCGWEDSRALVLLPGWEFSHPSSRRCLPLRSLLPERLRHLLNCVMASLLSPSLAQAQPWCRYPAALQVRQRRLSFSRDRSPAPRDRHSVCSSLSSTRSTRGTRSVVRLMTSSQTAMASWCLPACSKAEAASRNTSGILGRAEPSPRVT